MHITGDELRLVLLQQETGVEIHDAEHNVLGTVAPDVVIDVLGAGGRFAGVGNRRRIRFIKPDDSGVPSDWSVIRRMLDRGASQHSKKILTTYGEAAKAIQQSEHRGGNRRPPSDQWWEVSALLTQKRERERTQYDRQTQSKTPDSCD